MYRFSTACLAGLVVFLCLGVTVSADAQTCACASEFAFVRAHLEANYAGYDDKVTATTKPAYLKQVAELEAKAKKAKGMNDCVLLMQEYIAFFKDGHIQLGGKPTSVNTKDPVAVKQLHDATEKLQLSAEDLTRISSSKGIEGIYYNQDSTYKIALVVKKRLLAHT